MEKSFEIIIAETPKGKPDNYNEMRYLQGKELEGIIWKQVYRLKSISKGLMRDEIKRMAKRKHDEYKLKYPDKKFTSAVREVSIIYKTYLGIGTGDFG